MCSVRALATLDGRWDSAWGDGDAIAELEGESTVEEQQYYYRTVMSHYFSDETVRNGKWLDGWLDYCFGVQSM